MITDYKTTITYFIVILAFIYSVITDDTDTVGTLIFPIVIMWAILKTNSKELIKELVEAFNNKRIR